ncbi:23S rRNA (pseudouridine(1915)-N(3))-methyltransferase RlmH [Alicyclobacillus sp. SO9]|uniref:23S rRNA (pseudouridine(1915)-N(3))-methyltransferase RlmH n=1 Tax=Alicyclobacillus sp. SO9 TaxID=2665646 RepID=UPI0018E8DA76|nr:23S rRNA (pseudouridine(1915)-N(3))-methyltransferase RlmH [Alicyclobacillus sp. SO9]QQE81510.1 23S rRNA (pseudouridine(1915)-N(3))-methyltransferase RlmH [Alicyclobacillus sp. SO9]
MQIQIICVGKLKERYWKDAVSEYEKRLSGYVKLKIQEVADEPAPDNASVKVQQAIQDTEGERITKYIRDRDGIVALDVSGSSLSSVEWSQEYTRLIGKGFSRLVFLIGGSYGLSHALLSRADFRWSFGPVTLPHQLARVVLMEQIYRGIRIARGEPYHK